MREITFQDLATALSGSSLAGAGSEAFAVPPPAGFFVDPVLVVKEELDDLQSEIILVSARGAAGKSRSATELASQTQAPLWRLERDDAVGRAALPFKLNTYLGAVNALDDIAMRPTRPTLFIDSLDEARSRVSAQSWEEFLDSVAEAVGRGLRIVLFGRDRTLEEVWLKLADAGRSIAWLEVSHFPGPSQRDYIDGRVREGNAAIPTDGVHYVAARDALLAALAGSVDDGSADTFVGYAPVLDAVATVLLREQNYFRLEQEFASAIGGSRHIEVLRRILHGLLERDQRKLETLAQDLGLDPTAIYTPGEQIEWLWHDLIGSAEPSLGYITDPAKEHDYRQKLRQFLDDHPFRSERRWASAVFEAYAAAERLEKAFPPKTLVEVGTHSGLLFDFVAAGSDQGLVIDEWQFAALHASILAGESAGSAATVSAVQSGDLSFEGNMEVTRPSGALSLSFTMVPEKSEVVALVGPLESLTLSTPGAILVPPLDSGKVIGSDLYLRCESLHIEGNEARFARTSASAVDEGTDIRIEVTGSSVILPPVISVSPTDGTFELAVTEDVQVVYPWINYRTVLDVDEGVDPQSKAIRFLKKLQSLARTHGHRDGRATFFMKLQGRQPLKAAELREVLAVLESKGVVRIEGLLVFLTPEADEHRFSGKEVSGQRTIEQDWDYWGPIVQSIESVLTPAEGRDVRPVSNETPSETEASPAS